MKQKLKQANSIQAYFERMFPGKCKFRIGCLVQLQILRIHQEDINGRSFNQDWVNDMTTSVLTGDSPESIYEVSELYGLRRHYFWSHDHNTYLFAYIES